MRHPRLAGPTPTVKEPSVWYAALFGLTWQEKGGMMGLEAMYCAVLMREGSRMHKADLMKGVNCRRKWSLVNRNDHP